MTDLVDVFIPFAHPLTGHEASSHCALFGVSALPDLVTVRISHVLWRSRYVQRNLDRRYKKKNIAVLSDSQAELSSQRWFGNVYRNVMRLTGVRM